MRMCNMCSVAATRGAAAAAAAAAKSTLCKFNCKHKAETGSVDFWAELTGTKRERQLSLVFSSLLCMHLPRGADFPTANVYIYICMCWYVPVCVRQNYICYTYNETDLVTAHTHTCSEKNKIFVMSLLSHIKVQVQPI